MEKPHLFVEIDHRQMEGVLRVHLRGGPGGGGGETPNLEPIILLVLTPATLDPF